MFYTSTLGVSPVHSTSVHSARATCPSISGSVLKISTILLCALLFFTAGSISFAAELVNINAADVESIATALVGIGPAKAQAIVEYREQFGAFQQIQDITRVPGIGDVTLDQIKSLITLGNAEQ